MKRKRPALPILLLVGPLPEPRGGISVHIERLGRLLASSFRVRHVDESSCRKPGVFNLRSLNPVGYLARIISADCVHVHSGRPGLRMLHVAAARALGRRVVVTLHGCTFTTGLGFFLDRLSLPWAHQVVIVDMETGARLGLKRKALVRSAFIPPSLELEPELAIDVRSWIARQRRLRRRIFVANAWRLDLYRGSDLYGLDLCIELALRLKDMGKAFSIVFAVSTQEGDGGRFLSCRERIRALGLEDEFLLLRGPLSFFRLIREADCVLRPTRADGDSLTVREALFLGKPVIASDVTARPDGVDLFRSGDAGDLTARVMALAGGEAAAAGAGRSLGDDLDFYRGLYEGRLN